MKELTRAEEQVMQILWKIKKGFVKDILKEFSQPKPAYTTVSTIVRILERKQFVSYKAFGKSHQYYPLVSKKEYSGTYLKGMVQGYFSNSYKQLVSFFSEESKLSIKEMEEIKAMIEAQIEIQKKEEQQ